MLYDPPSSAILASDLFLYTDASDIGYGAVYENRWIQGSWPKDISKPSISYRELFAITAAALTWGHNWAGKRIIFVTDNKPITQIWHTGSSPCPDIMSLIRPLYLHAAKCNFSIAFKHIFGTSNPTADALSRFQMTKFFALHPTATPEPTAIPQTVKDLQYQTG